MRAGFWYGLVVAGCLAAAPLICAQTPAGGSGAGQSAPAAAGKKPAAAPPQSESNPFPEDESTVPVIPTKIVSGQPQGNNSGSDNGSWTARLPLPNEDIDPVRSPDDPAPEAGSGTEQGWSDSLTGLDKLLPGPDDDQTGRRKGKQAVIEPEHKETPSEDMNVGKFYMETGDWKGALSRFQSALVLAPEEPEVYWGLAECERHLGDFWDAKTYYQDVALYDPDSRHGKDAMKRLREPEIANAKKPAAGQTAAR